MRKYIILLLFLFVTSIFSQRGINRREGSVQNFRKPVLIESNIIPSDSTFLCYFSFKIPFNNILFVKESNNFTGKISLKLEVHQDGKYIKSETVIKKISVADYNLTNSEDNFLEGLLSIALAEGNYSIKPSLNIENVNRDIFLRPFTLNVKMEEPRYIHPPIPIYKEKYEHNNLSFYRLVNAEGFVPHSIVDFPIIIPVADESINEITVSIIQDNNELLNETVSRFETIGMDITDINNAVVLKDNSQLPKTNLFLVHGFSTKLHEGSATLKVKINKDEKEFELRSGWIGKPRTLINPEFAIRILENVTPNDKLSDLTDGDEEEYYENLVNYWKTFDQNKETAFNEVMNEFYQRADYAVKEYSTPNKRDGTNTDRGKTYIRYGKPDKVERSYSDSERVIEVWIYEDMNKKFAFADKDGLGNFTLLK